VRLECDVHVTQVVQEACGREPLSGVAPIAVKSKRLDASEYGAPVPVLECESSHSVERSVLVHRPAIGGGTLAKAPSSQRKK